MATEADGDATGPAPAGQTWLGAGGVFGDTLSILWRAAPRLLLLVALPSLTAAWLPIPFAGLLTAGFVVEDGASASAPAAMINLVGLLQAGFSLGAAIHLAGAALERTPQRLGAAAMTGVRAGAPLTAYLLVLALTVGPGLYLLLAPGLFLLVVMSVAGPAIVLERTGFAASFFRSWRLTRGFRWRVLLCVLPVASVVVAGAVYGVMCLMGAAASPPWFVLAILEAVLIAGWGVLTTVIHRRLLAAHAELARIDRVSAFD